MSTNEVDRMTPTTFVVGARDLGRLLRVTIPYARSDDTLSDLHAVRVELRAGRLTTVATDRHVLGVATHPVEEHSGPDVAVTLPLSAVRHLARMLKGVGASVVVDIQPDEPPTFTVPVPVPGAPELAITGHEGGYVDWRRLVERALSALDDGEPAPLPVIGIRPEFLAKLKTLGDIAQLRVSTPTMPAVATAEDGWHMVLIMPTKTVPVPLDQIRRDLTAEPEGRFV